MFLFFLALAACAPKNNTDENAVSDNRSAFEKKLSKMKVAEVDTLYTHICAHLDKNRYALAEKYAAATTDAEKNTLLGKAAQLLLTTLSDSIFICWYGTGWDFNGTTTCPRQGNIACGYFVTTVLKQSGFNIKRNFLAQQASSVMIRTFCPDEKVKTITNNQTKKVFDYMRVQEDGIYFIGLDNHTGFLVKKGDEINFVDADYETGVDKVICEPMEESAIIKNNGFFVLGDLLHSDETMVKWLNGDAIE
ncbi:MAG: hypothetical protein HY064_17460 [Bacteroidetes bacterium]|nr:hypothetical protein [Bacteroidota bacterium]